MQDFAGLGIALGIEIGRLRRREKAQYAFGDRRIDPEGEQGGQDAVTSKRRAEPRDAGERIGAECGFGQQHVEVGDRAARELVEQRVRAVDGWPPGRWML